MFKRLRAVINHVVEAAVFADFAWQLIAGPLLPRGDQIELNDEDNAPVVKRGSYMEMHYISLPVVGALMLEGSVGEVELFATLEIVLVLTATWSLQVPFQALLVTPGQTNAGTDFHDPSKAAAMSRPSVTVRGKTVAGGMQLQATAAVYQTVVFQHPKECPSVHWHLDRNANSIFANQTWELQLLGSQCVLSNDSKEMLAGQCQADFGYRWKITHHLEENFGRESKQTSLLAPT